MIPEWFDWKKPDYRYVIAQRAENLLRLREFKPQEIEELKAYYRDHLADYIEDWGTTFDPRMPEVGLPAAMPFLLFPKQREFVDFIMRKWREQRRGLGEKSRDCGISWVCVGVGCALGALYDGVRIGYGSRKSEYVDKADEPKSLFWKARYFLRHVPAELRAGWREEIDAPYMRINFPDTGSSLAGEGGDDIGRGDRASIYFVDEAAHLPRPMKVEAALSQTTNCRIDVSSVNGPNNVFAKNRFGGKIEVFVFDWRDDPRKDDAWYEAQVEDLDPIVLAQEVDRDYNASVEGVLIPKAWVDAAVDALEKLGIAPSGEMALGFDVADEGKDKNAAVGGQGVEISVCEEWSGKGDDIFGSTQRVFAIADEIGAKRVKFDSDGLGAGVRGDARVITAQRAKQNLPVVSFEPYRGSGEIVDPESEDVQGRKNVDYFANRKAQEWWRLRTRFLNTYRWIVKGKPCDPGQIISISSKMKNFRLLCGEISQVTFATREDGKVIIKKAPGNDRQERMPSPNKADALVIRFAKTTSSSMPRVSSNVLARARTARPGYPGIFRLR